MSYNNQTIKLIDNLQPKSLEPPHYVVAHDVRIDDIVEQIIPPSNTGDMGYTKLRENYFEIASDNELLSQDVDLVFKATASATAVLHGDGSTLYETFWIKKNLDVKLKQSHYLEFLIK